MQFRLFREGKGWMATPPGFDDLADGPFGYARTPEGAIADLLGSSQFAELAARRGWRLPNWTACDTMDAFEPADVSASVGRFDDGAPLIPHGRTSLRLVHSY